MTQELSSPADAAGMPRQIRTGRVNRVGPWMGHAGSEAARGLVLMLDGDSKVYLVLSDRLTQYPAGLTQAGDTVTFEASEKGLVDLTTFWNQSLRFTTSTLTPEDLGLS